MIKKQFSEPWFLPALILLVGTIALASMYFFNRIEIGPLLNAMLGLSALCLGIWNRRQQDIDKKKPSATMNIEYRPQYTLKQGEHLLGWRAGIAFQNPTSRPIRVSKIEILKPKTTASIQATTRPPLYGPPTEPPIGRSIEVDWLIKADGSSDSDATLWIFCPTNTPQREEVHLKLTGRALHDNKMVMVDCGELLRGIPNGLAPDT